MRDVDDGRFMPQYVTTSSRIKNWAMLAKDCVRIIMLGPTADGDFTIYEHLADVAHMFAAFPSNALTGQSLVDSHG